MKRMIFFVTLLAVLALAVFGVSAINTSASPAAASDQAPTAAIQNLPSDLMLASDPPLCPPGVPPPCG
jgi:hypothetical protein